jgi:hypothetical protein
MPRALKEYFLIFFILNDIFEGEGFTLILKKIIISLCFSYKIPELFKFLKEAISQILCQEKSFAFSLTFSELAVPD